MVEKHIVKRAIREASLSDVIRGKVGAVLFTDTNHVIVSSHNCIFFGSDRIKTIHAEEALMNKAYRINAIERYGRKLNVLVIRWKPGVKELACARPCVNCQRLLDKTCFTVFYTDIDGRIIKQQ